MTTRRAIAVTSVLLAAAMTASGVTLTISPASLQPPQTIPLNQAYSVGLTASFGGLPPEAVCVWSISSGALPPGLTIASVVGMDNGAGQISGTPTQAGQFAFTATCVAGPDSGSRAYTLLVVAPLSITQTSIPAGTQNTAYSSQLTAVGGVPPYTWTFGAGTNSDGLGICPQDGLAICAAGGLIFGTPTGLGSFTLNVVVKDAAGQTATVPLTLVVAAGVIIQTSSLVPAAVGVNYSQTLVGSGGKTPYAWSVSAGSLPPGMALDPASGIISGTPTAGGVFPFTITLTDATPVQATAALTINVLGITTTSLPDAAIGTAYSQTLQAAGGVPPLTWALASGTLPAGLTLNASTGTISGTPTTSGSSTFTVSASYTPPSVAAVRPPVTTQQQLTLFVAGSLTITASPLTLTEGAAFSQSLGTVTGGTGKFTWAIVTGTLPAGLQLDPATGIVSGTTTAAAGTTSITFSVTDSSPKPLVAQATTTITVNAPPPFTSATITGLPATSGPLQQQLGVVSISGAYPLDIIGTLTLAFASSVGGDDQMVRFSSGTCVVNGSSHTCTTQFLIPAGSTQGSFNGATNVSVITGTVAGTITITAQLTDVAGNNVTPSPAPTSTLVVNATVPFISSVTFTNPAPGQLNVTVVGFSSTRDMVSGLFHFTSTTGTTLASADITVQLGSPFTAWYTNTASNVFGSEFTLTIPFTYQANAIPVVSVTVTLTNSKNPSNPFGPAVLAK
jgi:Putative Ig domain